MAETALSPQASSRFPNDPLLVKLLEAAQRVGSSDFIIEDFTGLKKTYLHLLSDTRGQLKSLIPASNFDERGLLREEHVYVTALTRTGYQYVVAFFAVRALGGAYTPLDPRASVERQASVIARGNATCVLFDRGCTDEVERCMTSGTTRYSKGVVIRRACLTSHPVDLTSEPLEEQSGAQVNYNESHWLGGAKNVIESIALGKKVFALVCPASARAVLDVFQRHRITYFIFNPALLRGMRDILLGNERLTEDKQEEFSTYFKGLKFFLCIGGLVDQPTVDFWEKRYESVLRSKVVSKFIEGLSGVATIQAYGLKDQFVHELRSSIDSMNSAYYITFANQRWLTMRLDATGNLLVFVVGILVVTSRFSVNPSISGLVLSYILSVVQMLQFPIRQLSEVDKGINAVERLRYFGEELEQEASPHTVDIPESWPDKGEIVLANVEMRYRKNFPIVSRNLSIHINGGERVGIIGRTGAGKSSIISVLFRLVEISGGSITIDGIDISRIGLQDLRSRLTIVPQDPMLFQGTVRSNLDPFSTRTDMELWDALRRTGLANHEDTTSEGGQPNDARIHLDSIVEEDGLNFSLGQRQLMALARALVRDSRVIICDEATSSVDMETDEKIQVTMAAGFRGKTVVCIAHRLRTIIGYDRICVVDGGQIAELDTPASQFAKKDGIFRGMCDRSGIRLEDIHASRDTITDFGSGDTNSP